MKPLRLSLLLPPWMRLGLVVIATLLAVPVACAAHSSERSQKTSIAILLFPGFDPLDVMGPLGMYSRNPEFEVKLVAKTLERVPSSDALVSFCTGAMILGAAGIIEATPGIQAGPLRTSSIS